MLTLQSILRVLAPFDCLVCYKEGSLLCIQCQERYILPLSSRCYRCLAPTANGEVCMECRPHTAVTHAWVATEYGHAARELMRALKFARAQSAATLVAALMHRMLPAFPPGSVITYIPTATTRVRERGYDQAALIARKLAKHRGLPCRKLLRRHGQTRQVGATRAQRQQQLQAAFSLAVPRLPKGHIILVDDVTTTGATIEAAAKVLHQNGAKHISAALFAQKSKK